LKIFAGELYHNHAHFAVTVWREWTQVICGYSRIEGMWWIWQQWQGRIWEGFSCT